MSRITTLVTEVFTLKNEEAEQALQSLGWMPPDRAQEVLDVLRQIICDLPANRDWLDPELEMRAKEILRHETETRSANSDKLHKEVAEGPQSEGEGTE